MAKSVNKKKRQEQDNIVTAHMVGVGVLLGLTVILLLLFFYMMNADGRVVLQEYISNL